MYRLISIQTLMRVPVTDKYRQSKIGHLYELQIPTEGGAICLSNEVESFITSKIQCITSWGGLIVIITQNSIYKFRKEETL